ncbi:hypothetical protein GOP47_0002586 [Adiantum capillus-veneris]|uniref:Uncharacterized protein n=1 Tax=Adiantum capillus-veneris TaxID=13818 RepID=A0A9D4VAV6_ADICA|nr:hypothetical protein GOP47_0002586 [Adiantum capillus-veneris]
MAERRSWPWKKKITEKLASAALEFKQGNEQLDLRIDLKDHAAGMTPLQQAEAKIRILSEQLTAKDEVVLQHARVAEEAVSGWEKAESEAAAVREQLDAETQKILATEDRVAHLDGALKECMRQLRHVREQQELKLHEAIVKKTQEWEETRSEMEAKMAKLASELLEAEAEKTAINKLLQERAKAIKEAKEGRSIAEEDVKLLQVKLETAEKDQNKWKYELHVLSKELQIRNEELEYNKKASEAANKQHLENVKKVAKLETECQRLRLLVRKKLPGPAAISQMRLEVEALGIVPSMQVERGRRMSPSRRSKNSTWKPDRGDIPWMMGGDVDEEQFLAMAEENKALREALNKSNIELEAARMLCVHKASKLSAAEEQLENVSTVSSYHGLPRVKHSSMDGFTCSAVVESSQDPSVASVSEDGGPENDSSCAEPWATARISELFHFHKAKGSSLTSPMLNSSCDLMDDFAEMEKLASMPPDDDRVSISMDASKEQLRAVDGQTNLSKDFSTSGERMKSLCKSCGELRSKLSVAENELNVVRLQRLSARAALLSIEKRLTATLQGGEPSPLTDALDEVRAALSEVGITESKSPLEMTTCSDRPCLEMEPAEVRDTRVWSPSDLSSCQSDESTSKQDGPLATVKVNNVGRELIAAMHKVACLIDSLSQVDFDALNSEGHAQGEREDSSGRHEDSFKQWRSSDVNSCVQSLVTLCDGVLQGKVDMMDFLVEITSALDWLVSYLFSMPNMVHETTAMRRQLGLDRHSVVIHDSQTSDNIPTYSNGTAAHLHSSMSGTSTRNEQESPMNSFDGHLMKQFSQLKADKDKGDEKLRLLMLEVEALTSQLEESRLAVSNLQGSLTSAVDSKGSLTAELESLVSAKNSLESELLDARDDIKRLEERAQSLEVQLQDETQCRKDIEAMYQDLMGRQSCSTMEKREVNVTRGDLDLATEESAAKIKKDQEIAAAAEKLAECQQTILALGKQLKDLGLPTNGGEESPALRLSPYKSPISEHRSHSMCDQLPSMYGGGMDSANTSPIGFYQPIGEEEDSSFSDERSRTASSRHGSLRGLGDGRHGTVSSYGGYSDTTHTGPSCEALLSPDRSQGLSRGKGFISPDFQDSPPSRRTSSLPSKDLALTSPGRSPARFLSIRRRGGDANNNKLDVSAAEKHANGFTRFFSRNKASR